MLVPLLIVAGVAIFVIFILLSGKGDSDEREGRVKGVLGKDALSVDFGGKLSVVKFFGLTIATDMEMLDDKILEYLEGSLSDSTVKVKFKSPGSSELVSGEVYSLSGEYINAVLVSQGFARWSHTEAPGDQALSNAQDSAKASKLGIWNPAIRQLMDEKLRTENSELSDDDISNMNVDPSTLDTKERDENI